MSFFQKAGPVAAFLNAGLAVLSLIVAFVLIGPAALSDRAVFVDLALHNPAPLYLQDVLKFASAGVAIVLIGALYYRLRNDAPKRSLWAVIFGAIALFCLLTNAVMSLMATSQAATLGSTGEQFNLAIGILGMAAIFFNGPWYLLNSSAALKSQKLPKGLAILGLIMGAMSLLPFLGVLVLLLSIIWSVWLGLSLRKTQL
jgi:hypothetical protein